MLKQIALLFLVVLHVGCPAIAAIEYGPTVFYGDVSTGVYTSVENATWLPATNGVYTNSAVYTNCYRISATNGAGRIPFTNLVVSFTGDADATNAIALSWARKNGMWAHVVEQSYDAGTTWTNWKALSASTTNWTDYGTNAWTATTAFSNLVELIPAPTTPWVVTEGDPVFAGSDFAGRDVGTNAESDIPSWGDIGQLSASLFGAVSTNDARYLAALTNAEEFATDTQGDNADTAHGWGDHSVEGYLLAEVDDIDAVMARGSNTTLTATFGNLISSGRLALGPGASLVNIDPNAKGSVQIGYFDNAAATIGSSADGSFQIGRFSGTATLPSGLDGAGQIGYFSLGCVAEIAETAVGAIQQGAYYGTAYIGPSAMGARQLGYVGIDSTASNRAPGAVQIFCFGEVSGEHALTTASGWGSLLIGAGTATNKHALVVGPTISHGANSISAAGGVYHGNDILAKLSVVTAADAAFNSRLDSNNSRVMELMQQRLADNTLLSHPYLNSRADWFVDQSQLDAGNSSNYTYNAEGDYYVSLGAVITGGGGVPETDLVHLYKMNDNAVDTVVVDSVSASNGVAWANTDALQVAGKINGALSFDGSETSRVTVMASDVVLKSTNGMSFSCWIKANVDYGSEGNYSGVGGRLFYSETPLLASASLTFYQGTCVVYFDAFGAVTNATSFPTNEWIHCAMTIDDAQSELYWNGELVSQGAGYSGSPFTNEIHLGNGLVSGSGWGFDGVIDAVAFWNRSITAEEVTQLYNSGTGVEDPGVGGEATTNTYPFAVQSIPFISSLGVSGGSIHLQVETNAGEVVFNQDIGVNASADAGTTWTNVTLTSQGLFNTGIWNLTGNYEFPTAGTQICYQIYQTNNLATPVRFHGIVELVE